VAVELSCRLNGTAETATAERRAAAAVNFILNEVSWFGLVG
jgi:hypothetical protein